MFKTKLKDDSSCCSMCFEMLEAGQEVFIDSDNDIVCEDCRKEIKPSGFRIVE